MLVLLLQRAQKFVKASVPLSDRPSASKAISRVGMAGTVGVFFDRFLPSASDTGQPSGAFAGDDAQAEKVRRLSSLLLLRDT